jgi:ABC-2 type transport system permease protein
MAEIHNAGTGSSYKPPNSVQSAWLIGRRQMLEAVRDRSTLIMTGFLLVIQAVVMLSLLQSLAQGHLSPKEAASTSTLMVFGLLYVGLLPVTPAVGIASGVFAGDKERGSLTPLLVTPLSNTAIFAGKILGAVLPALIYALIGIIVYFTEIALFFGVDKLGLFPIGLSIAVLVLIPAITLLGASLASLISSRVSTFQAAQNYTSIILIVFWFALAALLFLASSWGLWVFMLAVICLIGVDVLLILIGAATWRREEVMAQR